MKYFSYSYTWEQLLETHPNSRGVLWKDLPIGTTVKIYVRADEFSPDPTNPSIDPHYVLFNVLEKIPASGSESGTGCSNCGVHQTHVWNAWNGSNKVHVCPTTELTPKSKLAFWAIFKPCTIGE